MSCDCKKTGRYLGSFERCQTCLTPHYWGPAFVEVRPSAMPLPTPSGRLPYPSECEYGFRAKHSKHPKLEGIGPDERTAKIDLYKKEKTERLRALAKPAGLTFTMPYGPKVNGAEVARRLNAPHYANCTECKIGDTIEIDDDVFYVVAGFREPGEVQLVHQSGQVIHRDAFRLTPVHPSCSRLAKTLRVDDAMRHVTSGATHAVIEIDYHHEEYRFAHRLHPFRCTFEGLAKYLREGVITIVRREQLEAK